MSSASHRVQPSRNPREIRSSSLVRFIASYSFAHIGALFSQPNQKLRRPLVVLVPKQHRLLGVIKRISISDHDEYRLQISSALLPELDGITELPFIVPASAVCLHTSRIAAIHARTVACEKWDFGWYLEQSTNAVTQVRVLFFESLDFDILAFHAITLDNLSFFTQYHVSASTPSSPTLPTTAR